MNNRLTEGAITPSLIRFSLPLIGGNLVQQLYNVADTLIVGRTLGSVALSAVGSAYALMVLINSIILGLCMGSGVVFSQLYGAGNSDALKRSLYNAFVLIMGISVLLNGLAFALLEPIMGWLQVPKEAINGLREYLRVIFVGILAVSLYNFFAAALRSVGNTMLPLIFLAISALTNIVLDLMFILWFNMGVAGAAWATVIAQFLSALLIALYFYKGAPSLRPSRRHMQLSAELMRNIFSNSLLTAIQQSIMNFGILMVQGLVNSFGLAASAAFSAAVKVDAFAYMPAQDFGNAFATFVAQNYGAGRRERINQGIRSSIFLSLGFCAVSSLVVTLLARQLMLLFVQPHETEIIAIGMQYLRIEGACYVGIGVLFLLYGLYRGLGRSKISIVLTVLSLGSRVALAYLLSALPQVGMVGIWWSVPIGWALADLWGLIYYLRRREKLMPKDFSREEA